MILLVQLCLLSACILSSTLLIESSDYRGCRMAGQQNNGEQSTSRFPVPFQPASGVDVFDGADTFLPVQGPTYTRPNTTLEVDNLNSSGSSLRSYVPGLGTSTDTDASETAESLKYPESINFQQALSASQPHVAWNDDKEVAKVESLYVQAQTNPQLTTACEAQASVKPSAQVSGVTA